MMLHNDEDYYNCLEVIKCVQEFLHNEVCGVDIEYIRKHLDACEGCAEVYDTENVVAELVRRCCKNVQAPVSLRMSISTIHIYKG